MFLGKTVMDKEGAAKKEGWGWGENTYIASGIFPI